MTPQEILERHVHAGLTRNAEAQAAPYAPDGDPMALVRVFRPRDGESALTRDRFSPDTVR